jgi:NAD(P)H dehydrogenase (quinone)
MHAHFVLAHPEPQSFNASLVREGAAALKDGGWTVSVSDLYAMGFDPCERPQHFIDRSDPRRFDAQAEQGHASARGTLPSAVTQELELLDRADLLVLQYPMWWHLPPAILKGWFDRVFVNGFAFGLKDESGLPRKYGDGGLAGRRVLAVITAGDRGTSFEPRGLNGDLEELFFPFLHGTAWYTGMRPLRPHLVSGVDRPGWDRFDDEVARLRERIAGLAAEEPIRYRALADGDYGRDRRLRADVLPGERGLAVHCVDDHRLVS